MSQEPLDIPFMTKELDWVMSRVFLGDNSAFLGSILSAQNFIWDRSVKTARTNGTSIKFNPDWFLSMERDVRATVLIHELWHPAQLYWLRRGDRDKRVWNAACDIWINNMLSDTGYQFGELKYLRIPQLDRNLCEEDIYDILMTQSGGEGSPNLPEIDFDEYDNDCEEEPSKAECQQILQIVLAADQFAKSQGQPGLGAGSAREHLNQFLAPVVHWEVELADWMKERMIHGKSYRRPNRRHRDIYLPTRFENYGALEHLIFFQDVSGSISQADSIRFNSELFYIKKRFKPKKMSIVQFDTIIQKVDIITDRDEFNEIEIIGRGGTSLECVRDYIEEHQPTAAIIFSDMYVTPMEPLTSNIPILWISVNNIGATVPFGKILHIKS